MRPDLLCPLCDKAVLMVYNEWKSDQNMLRREYFHREDVVTNNTAGCVVELPYNEGLKRSQDEAARPGDPMPTDW